MASWLPRSFTIIVVSLAMSACASTPSQPSENTTFENLNPILQHMTENVAVPEGWTVEVTGVRFDGLGYQALENPTDRGSWQPATLAS